MALTNAQYDEISSTSVSSARLLLSGDEQNPKINGTSYPLHTIR